MDKWIGFGCSSLVLVCFASVEPCHLPPRLPWLPIWIYRTREESFGHQISAIVKLKICMKGSYFKLLSTEESVKENPILEAATDFV